MDLQVGSVNINKALALFRVTGLSVALVKLLGYVG